MVLSAGCGVNSRDSLDEKSKSPHSQGLWGVVTNVWCKIGKIGIL